MGPYSTNPVGIKADVSLPRIDVEIRVIFVIPEDVRFRAVDTALRNQHVPVAVPAHCGGAVQPLHQLDQGATAGVFHLAAVDQLLPGQRQHLRLMDAAGQGTSKENGEREQRSVPPAVRLNCPVFHAP